MLKYTKCAELTITIPKKVEIFESLLRIECEEFYKKVKIKLKHRKNSLSLEILSEDISSLRAALSSVLSWLKLILEIEKMCKKE